MHKTYGDTVHTLIERGDYAGVFPGFNQVYDNEKTLV